MKGRKGLTWLIILSLFIGMGWAENEGTLTKPQKEVKVIWSEEGIKQAKGGAVMNETSKYLEEYVPKVIIDLKWEKVKEKLVPTEGDPWKGWISCGIQITGRFGEETVSFGSYEYSVSGFVIPRSITIDQEENLYILDPANLRVLKFDKNGVYLETINLERSKSEKGQAVGLEIGKGYWLGESENIYVDQNKNIYLCNVRNAWGNLNTFKFSKIGKFIGTGTPYFEEKGYNFVTNIQSPNRGVVQVIDQKKDIKKEIFITLSPNVTKKGYRLDNLKLVKEDKEGNLYIKTMVEKIEEKPKFTYGCIEQIHKYDSKGNFLFAFNEKENYDYIVRGEISATTVVTEEGVVYELIVKGRKEKEKKEKIYKLDPSDKIIKDLPDIEWFLKSREESIKEIEEEGLEEIMKEEYGKEGYPKKGGKITLIVFEGRFEGYEELKVIKWEKKR